METLDVPEVNELPQLGPNEEDAVAFADMVLTLLFKHAPAVLHAEIRHTRAAVTWFIRPIREETEQPDIPVADSNSRGSFRSVLARFGDHYMGGQLYYGCYGCILRALSQDGLAYSCTIYMSNMGQSGFWIRVYAAVVAK